jgi:hypothetical protein
MLQADGISPPARDIPMLVGDCNRATSAFVFPRRTLPLNFVPPGSAQPVDPIADAVAPSQISFLFAHAGTPMIASRTRGLVQHVV